ncbi:HNH endonuclease [Sphingobium bisphenolivorans]|uniref:HNH endonuclease n=1 Tax=Sphingobium bisphenolivorans TaxID=1335760 RepID=UPI00056006B2|nr:HNH endonuclease [Sphingobium bisphenolivorans]
MVERTTFNVTRAAVLAAIAEYDALGQQKFLTKYGYKPARTYRLWHNGNPYDSKAIIGAAFGYLPGKPAPLRFDEFSGGQVYVVPVLEKLGFSFDAPEGSEIKTKNPLWTREQVILALDLYVKHKGRDPGINHPDVIEMSALLRQMATEAGLTTYRNPSGVIMKMMNFRSLDPAFTSKGGKGLDGASKLDEAIWAEFYGRPQELAVAAEAIREGTFANMDDDTLDEVQSYKAKEGKVSYRYHRTLERDRKVVAIRKSAALKAHGKLECEACGFDFVASYGARGYGFIEAHHTNPVHAMVEGDETLPEDLALICSNCHRMVHKAKPWLSVSELKALIKGPG